MLNTPAIHSPSTLLQNTAHRPLDLPNNRPWILAQTWKHLLFAHYPVAVEMLRPLIPSDLEIDTFDGEAWLGIVPFLMTGVRLRGLPHVPGTHTFPELNVRTYVTKNGKSGVWFFSLDANNPLIVQVARMTFSLPYYNAEMSLNKQGAIINYTSERNHSGAEQATFVATYSPTSEVIDCAADSLEHWLTERYTLFSVNQRGQIHIGHITHFPWQLHTAKADISTNTMAQASGITLPTIKPLLHYVDQIDVLAWAIEPV